MKGSRGEKWFWTESHSLLCVKGAGCSLASRTPVLANGRRENVIYLRSTQGNTEM
jgi:hypothetical protein